MKVMTGVLAGLLVGCATATTVPLPDGKQGYAIKNCNDMATCYKKAAELCGGGKYTLIGQDGHTVPIVSGTMVTAVPQYGMTVECEGAPDTRKSGS